MLHVLGVIAGLALWHGGSLAKRFPAWQTHRSRFKCAALKLAMIKNQHLAETLFDGNVYDCVCLYEQPAA